MPEPNDSDAKTASLVSSPDAEPSDVEPSDAEPSDAEPSDAEPSDAKPTSESAASKSSADASTSGTSSSGAASASKEASSAEGASDPPEEASAETRDDVQRCSNCDAPLHGRYCSACGQRDAERMLPLWGIVNELLEEIAELDVRLFRTLPAFFIPGKLTEAYINGCRRRYVRPLRLYLFASFCLFTVIAFQGATEIDSILNEETSGPADPDAALARSATLTEATRTHLDSVATQRGIDADALIDARRLMDAKGITPERIASIQRAALAQAQAQADSADQAIQAVVNDSLGRSTDAPLAPSLNWREEAARDMEDASWNVNLPLTDAATDQQIAATLKTNSARAFRDPKAFVGSLIEKGSYLMFLLLPVFALLLKLMYIRRGRLYAEHFIFTVHVHSFTFVAFACGSLLSEVNTAWISQAGSWIALSPFLYLYVAMMRVYKQGFIKTAFKALMILIIYSIVLSLGFVVLALAAILLL